MLTMRDSESDEIMLKCTNMTDTHRQTPVSEINLLCDKFSFGLLVFRNVVLMKTFIDGVQDIGDVLRVAL